jgi:capsular exopolysaccharide synthesis family protein
MLAFLLERLDRSAQTSRDVELALGRRVIGAIPKFSWRFRRGQWALVMNSESKSRGLQPTREAYRRLRSSVLFLARAERTRSVVVTSSRALEGKSTTAANVAVSLAVGGARVALVSADLRRPSLERLFGVTNTEGLSTFLSGSTDALRIEQIPGVENLIFVPAGPEPTNPGELLGSPRFAALIATLADEVDLVVIDTPPLGAAADALAAASVADGVVVVVDGKRTETTDLLEIRAELDSAGVTLLGAVLNRDASKGGGFLKRRRSRYGYAPSENAGKSDGFTAEPTRGLRALASFPIGEIGPRAAVAAAQPRTPVRTLGADVTLTPGTPVTDELDPVEPESRRPVRRRPPASTPSASSADLDLELTGRGTRLRT